MTAQYPAFELGEVPEAVLGRFVKDHDFRQAVLGSEDEGRLAEVLDGMGISETGLQQAMAMIRHLRENAQDFALDRLPGPGGTTAA